MILCESSSNSTQLAPGFRFHPTDEELVSYYLKRKVSGLHLRVDAIAEIDLYKKEPWELPSFSKLQTRDVEWYFFSPLDRKYSNKTRTNRATLEGYWKTTGKDRAVKNAYSNVVVGMKKTLVYHEGRAPKGKRTNWVMHEYRLGSSENDATSCENTTLVHPQDSFVVCRIFQKHGSGPQNGAQYGAPFIEEEWEDIQDNKIAEYVESHGNGHDAALMCLATEQYCAEPDADPKNQILASQQNNNESTESKDGQSHADEQTQCHVVDNPVADLLSESEEQVCDRHAYDSSFTLQDIFDFDKLNNIDGNLQESGICIDINIGRNSSIASDQNDGYLELNDVYANANGHCTNNTFNDCIRSNVANDASTCLNMDDSEVFNNYSVTTATEGVLNMQPYDYLNPRDGNYLEDDTMFYDALSNDVMFTGDTYMNINENPLFSPVAATDFDLADELMAYFNANEHDLPCDLDPLNAVQSDISNPKIISEVEGSNYPTCKECIETHGTNVGMGSPSTEFIDAANPLENRNKNDMIATDVQSNDGWNKSFRKHVVGMLGSISAPPAMAADSCKGKGIQISSSSSSSIHVSAGLIQIRGISVTEHPEKWTLSKDGEISFIYTYANRAVGKSACYQPPITAFGMLLRGGLFLFGVSALILSISMKLGVGIYRK